jgi:hypothetical protein
MSEQRLRTAEVEIARLQSKINAFERVMKATPGDLTVLPWKWQTWTPTFTGFSADPATPECRYFVIGKLCFVTVRMANAGTSNANGFTMTAPITAAYQASASLAFYVNGGTSVYGQGTVVIGENTATFTLNTTAPTWTASGDKRAAFQIYYETL